MLVHLKSSRRSCSAHTLAEAFNTLTRYPKGYGILTSDAWRLLSQLTAEFQIVSLTADDLVGVIGDAALRSIGGARVYDALILACARKVDAEMIYTFNVKHFQQIAPELAPRIMQP